MTDIGAVTPTQYGSVTRPDALRVVLPAANSKSVKDHGLFSTIGLPGSRGNMLANGMDPLYHTYDENLLRTGLLAPRTALTATPTGSQASAMLDVDVVGNGASPYNPSSGESIVIGNSITFLSALSTTKTFNQVLIGASASDTLDNLIDLLTQATGTRGVTWWGPTWGVGIPPSYITVTKPETYQVVVTINAYGSSGNSYQAWLRTGTWTDCSLGSQGGTVGTTGFFTGGADGTGSDPSAGTYRYRVGFYRSIDGATSGVGAEEEASQGLDQNIGLTAIPAVLEDDDIDYKRWWRTLNDGSKLYHGRDIVDTDVADTDDLDNTTLATHLSYDSAIYRPYEAGMIERVRYLAEHKGRWVGGGFIRGSEYAVGVCTVTQDSNVISLATGHPTKEMEHWTFNTNQGTEDDALDMEIIYVDEDARNIYVHADWEGASSTSVPVSYTIRDTRDPFRLYYCEPVLPNQTSASMYIDGVQSPDPRGITGIISAFESDIVFTYTGIWRLSGSEPVNFRLSHEYEGVGCVSGHSIVDTGDGNIYWLGADGIYGWAGVGEPFKVSNPPTGQTEEPRGISRTIARINAQHESLVFAHYDPERRIVRWCVPLDGAMVNTHAIVLDLQTTAWSLDKIPPLTYIISVSDEGGDLRTLAGDVHGCLWELDVSTSDGAYGFEPTQTVASGTLRTITLDNAVLPTSGDGMKGVPGVLLSTTGGFTPFLVYSNTSTVATLATALDTAPADGDYAIFGGIHLHIESGAFSYKEKAARKIFEALKLLFAVDTGEVFVSAAVNNGNPAYIESASVAATDGETHTWVGKEGRRHKIRLDAVQPGIGINLQGMRTWIRVSSRDG